MEISVVSLLGNEYLNFALGVTKIVLSRRAWKIPSEAVAHLVHERLTKCITHFLATCQIQAAPSLGIKDINSFLDLFSRVRFNVVVFGFPPDVNLTFVDGIKQFFEIFLVHVFHDRILA